MSVFSHAVRWAFVMKVGARGVLAAVTFVLAALLTPEDFGVVAIAMVYIAFARMLVDQGLTAALIQRGDLKEAHLDSVFWLVLSVSAGLTVLTWLAADWYAALNDVPLLGTVLIVLSIAIPIEGLTVVQKAILQKELDFKKLALRDNFSAVFGGALGIGSAFWGFGVWALVIQKIATDFTALVLLWSVTEWRPRLQFHWKSLKELLSFSVSNLIAKFGVFASLRTDIFLMGIFFGPLAVGLYRIADRISEMVVDLPTGSLQVASYPEFSRNQSDHEALRRRLLSVVKFSSCIALPLLLLIAGLSEDVLALIGEQWLPAAWTLSLLCVSYMFLIPTYFTGPLFQAMGRPIILAGITWAQVAVNIALLVGLGLLLRDANATTQTLGIAAIRAFTSIVLLLISVAIVKQMIGLAPFQIIRTQLPPLVSGLLGLATVWLLDGQISDNHLVELLVRGGSGVFVSGVSLFLLERQVRSMISTLKSEALRLSKQARATVKDRKSNALP